MKYGLNWCATLNKVTYWISMYIAKNHQKQKVLFSFSKYCYEKKKTFPLQFFLEKNLNIRNVDQISPNIVFSRLVCIS